MNVADWRTKMNINKIEDLVSLSKLGDLIHKGELEQKDRKSVV